MEYGLIGYPLKHSFSKEIHEKLDNYTYEICELEEKNFDEFMKKKEFKAINVTIPYKQKVIPYLDYISQAAEEIGAVNVIVNKGGKLYGDNTDYLGLKLLIEKNNIIISNKRCVILGTGGTSKTSLYVLKLLNAKEVKIASRTKTNNYISYDEICDYDPEVIINTTPLGMFPNINITPINEYNKSLEAIVDVVYNPLKTMLTQKFEKSSCNGLYMLVAQAYYACNLFTGFEHDIKKLDNIYNNLLLNKQNIVLIGMPSSGKSTIGKALAKKLNKEFVDTDEVIVKKIQMPIKDYFSKYGENEFRKIESSVILELSKKSGIVLSTGGGVIKNQENIDLLHLNGIICFIDRDLSLLMPTSDRPLSSNISDLCVLYNERRPLYVKYSDYIIKNNKKIKDAVYSIIKTIGLENN